MKILADSGASLAKLSVDAQLVQHASNALDALDSIVDIVSGDDVDIRTLLENSRADLIDSYWAEASLRHAVAFSTLRGFMEGMFLALYYRQQGMSLHLWARQKSFHMLHQLFDDKHEFCSYFKALFEDESHRRLYKVTPKNIFTEARDLYDHLCRSVHKTPVTASAGGGEFMPTVERILRLFFAFLDREEQLPPTLNFPEPRVFQEFFLRDTSRRTQRGNCNE